jgi:hypothetical protein
MKTDGRNCKLLGPTAMNVTRAWRLHVATKERRLALLPAAAGAAPCSCRPCSLRLPALLPLATLAPSGHRPCSLRRLALLHAAVVLLLVVSGAAPYGCQCCSHGVWAWSLRLPALLHIAFGLAPCGVRAWSLWLSALLPAESGLGPSGCRRCSLRWSVLLQALAPVLQGASGAATIGGRGARWS